MLPHTDRSAQRALGKAARAALGRTRRFKYSTAICRALEADPRVRAAKIVFSYASTPAEADPSSLCARLHSRGVSIAYPRCTAPGVMQARIPDSGSAFTPDIYGIPSPDPLNSRLVSPEELDLVLVPLTAFDSGCARVGMGGGFYDRFLPMCKNAAIIGLAFSVQQAEKIDRAPHDIRLHAVFTESGIFEACAEGQNNIECES